MTYRQVARGVVRTMHAIDRDNRRRARLHIAAEKAAQRTAMLQASSDASASYQQLVAALIEAHRIAFTRTDWATAAAAAEQPAAVRLNVHERNARAAADAYSPSWLSRTFGFATRKRAVLEADVERGIEADAAAFSLRESEVQSLNAATAFARQIISHDRAAMLRAVEESALSHLPFCLERARIVFQEHGRVIAIVDGLNIDTMPTQSVTLLASGKASVKALPQSRINELHRDNICSAAIRVALELLRVLPVPIVEVVMRTDLLDRATGLIDATPVLYLRATAQALAAINLDRADAFLLVERLGGQLNWHSRGGFGHLDTASLDLPLEETEE